MRITGIYKIQSKLFPEKDYIGSAVDISARWGRHKSELRRGVHSNDKLQRHCNKYGIEDLLFYVICECPKEELIKTEQYHMDKDSPYFNILRIAGSQIGNRSIKGQTSHMKGKKHTEETRAKIRDKRAKQDMSNHWISLKGKDPWNKGTKGEMVAWNKGVPCREETKRKLMTSKLSGKYIYPDGLNQHERRLFRKKAYYQLHKVA